MKERIIELLGNGIPQSIVAQAVGCDPSYISQLMQDEDVATKVALLKVEDIEESITVDNLIEDIELLALNRIKDNVQFAKPMDALRIFQGMNSAHKRTQESANIGVPTAPLVTINMPQAGVVAFRLSSDQQVVEIDGRSTATLPSKQLLKRLSERQLARPQITDALTADSLLRNIEKGIPQMSIANVL